MTKGREVLLSLKTKANNEKWALIGGFIKESYIQAYCVLCLNLLKQ